MGRVVMPEYPKCDDPTKGIPKKYRTRQEVKQHYAEEFHRHLKEEHVNYWLENAIDAGYCEGYNQVLTAAELVLSKEDYWKIVNKLEELGL